MKKYFKNNPEGLFLLLISPFLILLILGLFSSCKYKQKLMSECMLDKKEYECYYLLKDRRRTNNVPIIIGR